MANDWRPDGGDVVPTVSRTSLNFFMFFRGKIFFIKIQKKIVEIFSVFHICLLLFVSLYILVKCQSKCFAN